MIFPLINIFYLLDSLLIPIKVKKKSHLVNY